MDADVIEFCESLMLDGLPVLTYPEYGVYLRQIAMLCRNRFGKSQGKIVFDYVLQKLEHDRKSISYEEHQVHSEEKQKWDSEVKRMVEKAMSDEHLHEPKLEVMNED